MYLKANFLVGSLGYARWRMAVTLKAIYYAVVVNLMREDGIQEGT